MTPRYPLSVMCVCLPLPWSCCCPTPFPWPGHSCPGAVQPLPCRLPLPFGATHPAVWMRRPFAVSRCRCRCRLPCRLERRIPPFGCVGRLPSAVAVSRIRCGPRAPARGRCRLPSVVCRWRGRPPRRPVPFAVCRVACRGGDYIPAGCYRLGRRIGSLRKPLHCQPAWCSPQEQTALLQPTDGRERGCGCSAKWP